MVGDDLYFVEYGAHRVMRWHQGQLSTFWQGGRGGLVKARGRALRVWMNGEAVGLWERSSRGAHHFQYAVDWIRSPAARNLSLSLPFTPGNTPLEGAVVENSFDNLLPDSEPIRHRIRSRFQTRTLEPFDLLAAIGRDCVGAVSLLPVEETPELVLAAGRH